jgi:hypothetical protein
MKTAQTAKKSLQFEELRLKPLLNETAAQFCEAELRNTEATGNRQQATGNRQQATGNRQQATGNIIHIS